MLDLPLKSEWRPDAFLASVQLTMAPDADFSVESFVIRAPNEPSEHAEAVDDAVDDTFFNLLR